MDIKHVLSCNPLPARLRRPSTCRARAGDARPTWTEHPGGTVEVGHRGRGFSFDNELPRHRESTSGPSPWPTSR